MWGTLIFYSKTYSAKLLIERTFRVFLNSRLYDVWILVCGNNLKCMIILCPKIAFYTLISHSLGVHFFIISEE
jgi:hypothetical protein